MTTNKVADYLKQKKTAKIKTFSSLSLYLSISQNKKFSPLPKQTQLHGPV